MLLIRSSNNKVQHRTQRVLHRNCCPSLQASSRVTTVGPSALSLTRPDGQPREKRPYRLGSNFTESHEQNHKTWNECKGLYATHTTDQDVKLLFNLFRGCYRLNGRRDPHLSPAIRQWPSRFLKEMQSPFQSQSFARRFRYFLQAKSLL